MIDRMFETAMKLKVPVVFFTEGGGGRAGRHRNTPNFRNSSGTGGPGAAGQISGGGGLGVPSWHKLSQLSALVPLVGVVSGRCFAGNAPSSAASMSSSPRPTPASAWAARR
jgi:acetyl-CoA carboxylase carboxyltransferase component